MQCGSGAKRCGSTDKLTYGNVAQLKAGKKHFTTNFNGCESVIDIQSTDSKASESKVCLRSLFLPGFINGERRIDDNEILNWFKSFTHELSYVKEFQFPKQPSPKLQPIQLMKEDLPSGKGLKGDLT